MAGSNAARSSRYVRALMGAEDSTVPMARHYDSVRADRLRPFRGAVECRLPHINLANGGHHPSTLGLIGAPSALSYASSRFGRESLDDGHSRWVGPWGLLLTIPAAHAGPCRTADLTQRLPEFWGGKRKGAGRPRSPVNREPSLAPDPPSMAAGPRDDARKTTTCRVCAGKPSLPKIAALSRGQAGPGFASSFSVQDDHVHLIVEADDKAVAQPTHGGRGHPDRSCGQSSSAPTRLDMGLSLPCPRAHDTPRSAQCPGVCDFQYL